MGKQGDSIGQYERNVSTHPLSNASTFLQTKGKLRRVLLQGALFKNEEGTKMLM